MTSTLPGAFSYNVPSTVFERICWHYGIPLNAQIEDDGVRFWQPHEDGKQALVATTSELKLIWRPLGICTIFADRHHPVRQHIAEVFVEMRATRVLQTPDSYSHLVATAIADAKLRDLRKLDAAGLDRTLELVLQLIRPGRVNAPQAALITVDDYVRLIELMANRELQRPSA